MHCSFEEMIQAMLEGAMMGMYRYEKYVSRKDTVVRGVVKEYRVVVSDEGYQSRLKAIVDYTALLIDGTELARNMTNAPANELSPDVFAREAAALATKHGYKCSVLGRKEMETHKMAGMLAVSAGSKREPRFITLEYNETKRKLPSYVLVGKGITFDSGGLSIKPASAMEDMKTDMAGAAAVLAAMDVCARLKLPVRLIGLIPLTDNVIGGNAMCPGDIIRYSNGKSVEVLNTDAEGRLVLADALIYAHRYKPNCVIDIATLTGAIMVALGTAATGMMGTDEAVKSALKATGEKTRERVWEMPLYEEYDQMIKGTITDLKNQSGRWGGALTAGAFLKAFAGELPWVHLDIAGTATIDDPVDHAPKGATGVGVRLLVEFLKNLKPPA
jgi:leucyl aminopeptidase